MKKEWLKTMAVFDEYERRFAAARAEKPLSSPWEPGDRDRILKETKRMLAYRDDLVPTVRNYAELDRTSYGSYDGISCRYETWDKFYGSATLFLPRRKGPLPLTFVCQSVIPRRNGQVEMIKCDNIKLHIDKDTANSRVGNGKHIL